MIRLNKYLAQAGVASRRASDYLISEGHVKVNGVVATLGAKIDEADNVIVDGKPIGKQEKKEYFAVYKPIGLVSTTSDEFGREKVTDLIKTKKRLYPIGRLDRESEGLMILTNDGDLALKLTHPKYHLEKEYEVMIDKNIEPARLNVGINKIIKSQNNMFWIVMYEGKKRQIREICWEAGYRVRRLARVRIGKLTLGNLEPGQFKRIQVKDII
jgi:23S rRNA pseudouridine2605 synthase